VRRGLKSELVVMRLPRFTANQRLSMAPLLDSLGMKTAFTDSADFSRMCATEPLKINSVIHQAFVTVGEKGTEAAAATAVSMVAGSAAPREEPKPKLFIADHPFLFFIVDERNGGILFAGRVDMPEIAAPEK
jgi:serine protease inhibitor